MEIDSAQELSLGIHSFVRRLSTCAVAAWLYAQYRGKTPLSVTVVAGIHFEVVPSLARSW